MRQLRHNLLFLIVLGSLVLLSGCLGVTVTQKLARDVQGNHSVVVEAPQLSDEQAQQVSDALRRLDCKFKAEEMPADGGMTYSSDDCLFDKRYVKLAPTGVSTANYTLNASLFSSLMSDDESSQLTGLTFQLETPGPIIRTNGVKASSQKARFTVSASDMLDGIIYFAEYKFACLLDDDCSFEEACIDSSCSRLDCGGCGRISGHRCVPYECCSDGNCSEEKACVDNKCAPVECECGTVSGHTCNRYECCSNADCGFRRFCEVHGCKVMECEDDAGCGGAQVCVKYKCEALNCADDEAAEAHACKKLSCNIIEEPAAHKCQTSYPAVAAVLAAAAAVSAVIVAVAVFLMRRKLINT
jgi:hypothetical protein